MAEAAGVLFSFFSLNFFSISFLSVTSSSSSFIFIDLCCITLMSSTRTAVAKGETTVRAQSQSSLSS